MSITKQLWLLCGGNGAGKSTFYRTQLEPRGMPFVNADILAKQLAPNEPELHSYEAAKIAEKMRLQMLQDGNSFCFETVFSHPSKIDFVAHAKALGYQVVLVFIHLNEVAINHARVSQRVEEGGHFVPASKVRARVPRTLKNVRRVLPLCDLVYLLDNSSAIKPFKQVAVLDAGSLTTKQSPLPQWAQGLLIDYLPK